MATYSSVSVNILTHEQNEIFQSNIASLRETYVAQY